MRVLLEKEHTKIGFYSTLYHLVLRVSQVSYRYGEQEAFKGLTADVDGLLFMFLLC